MSYRVYLTAISRAVKTITDVYLYRLTEIISQANDQMIQADQIRQKSPEHDAVAINNIDINARTIELAQLYGDHLCERKKRLEKLAADMNINYELSRNTFKTVKVGAELIDVIKTGEKDLLSIFEFEAPQLDAFYDKELRREFDALTAQLKSGK